MSWKLSIGIHRGTMMSRDSQILDYQYADPSKPLTSLEEVQDTANKWKRNYDSCGVFIWFAYAISPEGEQIKVLDSVPYLR